MMIYFKGCSKYGKVHLDPSQIKTNTLIDKFSFGFNVIHKRIIDAIAANGVYTSFGKYSVFALEQMIRNSATASLNQTITVAFEINAYHTMGIYEGKSKPLTSSVFTGTNL
jgi:hypothetical protein